MAGCKRKSFDEEWQAKIYIEEHPWPEPAPPVRAVKCHIPGCGKFHITDKPENGRKGHIGKKR